MKRTVSILVLALSLSFGVSAQNSQSFEMGKWVEEQNAILRELKSSYVDSLPVARMKKAAIDAMLAELDPYTVYVPQEEEDNFQMLVAKVYGGIGAIIYKPDVQGNVIINEPYEGSPALRYGLRCCDEILEINGQSTHGLTSAESSEKMKGQPGTEVTFLVKKAHTADTVEVRVVRERIHLPDIEYYGMLDKTTGYVLQSGFTENVADELRAAILDLRKQGMQTLVYDLRGNGGGIMQEAIKIVSLFVPRGSVVVSAKGKNPKEDQVYRTWTAPVVDSKMSVIVLVDGGSASASEIVSGALQDYDRATIMGRRTFGKGLVQSIRPLPYGGHLKITTARYYTPSGRCVQAIDYSSRTDDGEAHYIPDSLTHEFKTAHGRTVRDGGGITPDVELDITRYDDIVYEVVYAGLVEQYVLDYVRRHDSIAPVDDYRFDEFEQFREFVRGKVKGNPDDLKPEQICPFIEEEVVVRYYYQAAGVKVRLRYDNALKQALASPRI